MNIVLFKTRVVESESESDRAVSWGGIIDVQNPISTSLGAADNNKF